MKEFGELTNVLWIFIQLLCSFALPLAMAAQSVGAPASTFDTVSIREIEATHFVSGPLSSTTITTAWKPCTYTISRVACQLSLEGLIKEAFQLKSYEIVGPAWLPNDLFVFQATMPENTTKESARMMMQSALQDRFHLTYHREQRTVSIYAMIAAKGGPKLQPAEDAEHRKLLSSGGRAGASLAMSAGQFSAVAIPLDILAINLQNIADLDLPVVNMTGLDGLYKVNLHWQPNEDPEYTGFKDPGFRTAVRQQLGLILEKRRAPMAVMVIDHADNTPTEN